MPTVKNVGEPCARKPHARFEVAAGGNQASRLCRAAQAPLADPTTLVSVLVGDCIECRASASDLVDDLVCGRGPDEWLRSGVRRREVAVDRVDEV